MASFRVNEAVEYWQSQERRGIICECNHIADYDRGDSVLENRFWEYLGKTELQWHGAVDQFIINQYRVDAAVDCNGQVVVIELDGKAYHDADADKIRDAVILQEVAAIIRVPFSAMWHYPVATMAVLGHWFPRLEYKAHWECMHVDELRTRQRRVLDEEYSEPPYDEWFADVNTGYAIWDIDGRIGTAKQFLVTTPKIQITLQRGRQSATILDKLYEASVCTKDKTLYTLRGIEGFIAEGKDA